MNPLLISSLPFVAEMLGDSQQAMPQGGLGATKKQIVMNGVETLLKATTIETATLAGAGSNVGTNAAINAVAAAASAFIDSTIAALNQAKVFASKAK